MARIDDLLAVLSEAGASPTGRDPMDGALLALLAHVAFADGQVGDQEFALLSRLFPYLEMGEVLECVSSSLEEGLDVAGLAGTFPKHQDRIKALRFATHMAWADDSLDPGESQLIRDLTAQLQSMPEG